MGHEGRGGDGNEGNEGGFLDGCFDAVDHFRFAQGFIVEIFFHGAFVH